MIRGVNRQMIEVNETGHPYFERALLIVRADCEETGEGEGLKREADRFVAGVGAYAGLKISQRKRLLRRLAGQLAALLAGAGSGWLLSLWLR